MGVFRRRVTKFSTPKEGIIKFVTMAPKMGAIKKLQKIRGTKILATKAAMRGARKLIAKEYTPLHHLGYFLSIP